MLSIILTSLFALIIFSMGCYLGYQVGSTRPVREQLAKIRTNNIK